MLECSNPLFDRVTGEFLKVEGSYSDFKLQFTDLLLETGTGQIKGKGYFPLDFRLLPVSERLLNNSEMDFVLSSVDKNFKILTSYLDPAEELQGDVQIQMRLTGTPNSPVRDGWFQIENGTLSIKDVENPVINLKGRGLLTRNIMEISAITASMKTETGNFSFYRRLSERIKNFLTKKFKGIPEEPPDNVIMKGFIDLTNFFHPVLDLQLVGQKVYVRTFLGEIETIADANLRVTGQDTILISGLIEPTELYLRTEFTNQSNGMAPLKKGRQVVLYNIHMPIQGNFFMQNSQLDAELEGDMWLIKRAGEDLSFSGVLDVRRGKFYYYSDIFTIVYGEITFQPFSFNPNLNIRAITDIGEDRIIVTLTGDLHEPNLVLEDENQKYTQSDILALLTFNQRVSTESFDPSKLITQGQNIFGAFFEKELERYGSRMSGFDTFDLRTRGSILQPTASDSISIFLGRRLTENVYFTYERNLSSYNPSQQIGVEYRLNRYMSIIGNVDQNGLVHLRYRLKYQY
jgi:autotransporter translocation and assembly factor TamB